MKRFIFGILLLLPNSLLADTFNLAWDPVTQDVLGQPVAGLLGYKLYVSTTPLKANWPPSPIPAPYAIIPAGTTVKQVVKTIGGKYYAVVTAYNSVGESNASNEISFDVNIKSPAAPAGLRQLSN